MDSDNNLDRSLRDLLAIDRTRLANLRTLLAFVVTTTHFIALGITVAEVDEFAKYRWLSIPMFVVAAVAFSVGLYSFLRVRRDIARSYQEPQ